MSDSTDLKALRHHAHIDGLRAVAVLVVILFHLGVDGFSGGFVGVDVFFVISGYLITRQLLNELDATGQLSLRGFYTRRIRRLLPAYLVMLFLVTIAAIALFSPAKLDRYGNALNYAVVGLSNFVFWQEADYFDVSAYVKPLLHTWSLSVEEQFYLIWPLFLIGIFSFPRRYLLPCLVLFGLASLILNFVYESWVSSVLNGNVERMPDQHAIRNTQASLFFLTPFRMFEFVIGAVLVWVRSGAFRSSQQLAMHWTGLALIAAAVVIYDETLLFPQHFALVPCIGAALVIAAGVSGHASGVLSSPYMLRTGQLSYSLYLYHWPVIVFVSYLREDPLNWFDASLIIFVSFVLAYLSYHVIEEPFRRGQRLVSRNVRPLLLTTSVCALATAGSLAHLHDGWPARSQVQLDERSDYGGDGYPSRGWIGSASSDDHPHQIDIIFAGDSHARQYAHGVHEALVKRQGRSVYLHAGASCLHLPGVIRTTPDWQPQCPELVDELVELTHSQARPPTVVVAHSWLSQMARSGLSAAGNPDVSTHDVIASISALKARLGDSHLVIIGQLPSAQADIIDYLSRPALALRGVSARPRFGQLLDEQRRFNTALQRASEQRRSFTFYDPTSVLCDERGCVRWREDQQPFFADGSHLSRLGSRLVVEDLAGHL